jgi:predicted neuraminidase
MKYKLLFFLLLFPLSAFSVQKNPAIIAEYFISPANLDCHSSCIIQISPTILCAAWKGTTTKNKGSRIWISHFNQNKWSKPIQVVQPPTYMECWTPVLSIDPYGELRLYYRIGTTPRQVVAMYKRSTDGGYTWSDETILPAGINGPVKSKPFVEADGSMICGSSVEVGAPEDLFHATACWIEIFANEQWAKYGPIEIPNNQFGCIEPALFWDNQGNLQLLCRDRSQKLGFTGWIWTAASQDKGKTWSMLSQTSLPNPDSGIEALSIDKNNTVLIYNNSHTNRYPLTLALSTDNGTSWNPLFNLEEKSGEFPSAVMDGQGYLNVTYACVPSGKTRRIKHVVIDCSKLTKP